MSGTAPAVETLLVTPKSSRPYLTIQQDGTYTVDPGAITAPPKKGWIHVQVIGPSLSKRASDVLKQGIRQLLRAYPITDIREDVGLCFELAGWLKEHKKSL